MKIKHLSHPPEFLTSWAAAGRLETPIATADSGCINRSISDLLCPGCGSEYLHSGTVTVYDRDEDADLVIRTVAAGTRSRTELVKNTADNPSSRRHGITIQFECENCHADPELLIAQHKGNTQISWRYWVKP